MPLVIGELRSFDAGLDIVVVDDGSTDRTADVAAALGVYVLRLPFNLGIGGAVQTGFRFAHERRLRHRRPRRRRRPTRSLTARSHPRARARRPRRHRRRFALRHGGGGYRSSRSRRIGIRILAAVVSRVVGQRVTDTTSGFQALNRQGIALFAGDYPHDYPEVEATVMVFRHRLRLVEVPVTMRERGGGSSLDYRATLDLLHGESAVGDLRRPVPTDVLPHEDAQ